MSALLLVAAGVYGLVIGSFLNVVIYRVPAGMSVVRPPSACPGCGTRIRSRDNVPVLSWMLLRGRCRGCASPIAVRYPMVEVLTGTLFLAAALRFGWSLSLPAELVLVAGLVVLAFIDLDHMLLPRSVVYPVGVAEAVLLLAAAAAEHTWHRLAVAAACAAVEFLLLLTINLVSPKALGFGDVRLGPVIGLGLGWLGWRYAFWGFLAANLLGTLVGVGLIAAGKAGRKTKIPFGVFLAAGAIVSMMGAGYIRFPAA